jgi:peptide-methionine (R)-S-oxide reductase
MGGRRQFFAVIAAAFGLTPVVAWLGRSAPVTTPDATQPFPVTKSDPDWRATLTAAQYRVLREHATERPFSSPLNHEKRRGTFVCAGCGQPLYSSANKYESGTGWPSFWAPIENAIGTSVDRSYLMVRTEVHCGRCGGHLGHVFPDGPKPTGLRYCMNGNAMQFIADV